MLYLGIDSSTQGVKGVIIDPERKNITAEAAVNFGKDLPQYHSPNGFLEQENPLVRQSDPKMWLDGLELMLKRFQDAGVPMDQIAAISGSGQQHGSVYLNAEAETVLGNLPLSNISTLTGGVAETSNYSTTARPGSKLHGK